MTSQKFVDSGHYCWWKSVDWRCALGGGKYSVSQSIVVILVYHIPYRWKKNFVLACMTSYFSADSSPIHSNPRSCLSNKCKPLVSLCTRDRMLIHNQLRHAIAGCIYLLATLLMLSCLQCCHQIPAL